MTKDQVSLIRSICQKDDGSGNPLASVLSAIFNDEIMFRNTDDFIIYDDDNELIHAVKANFDNAVAGAAWPYKICTGFYGNIQFMEGLYNMTNFEKAIDQLFVESGLIDEDKKEMIMKWANGIRNHATVPKAPGPYYPSVPQIPPKPPVPECRPDGIWHAESIDQRTKKNIIFNLIEKAINNYNGEAVFKKTKPATYTVAYSGSNTDLASTFKNFADTLGKNLFYASLTNDVKAAIIDPRVEASTNNFVNIAATEILPQQFNNTVNIKLYVEAYGVRVKYDFITTKKIDQEEVDKWIEETSSEVEGFVNSISSDAIESATINGTDISVIINTTDDLDVGLVDFLVGIEGLDTVRWEMNNQICTLKVGDTATYQSFKEGVIKFMPTGSNETTNNNVSLLSENGGQLVYTLKVKYYNEADYPCRIGDTYYNTVSEACGIGGDIEILNDVTEDIVVPTDKTVSLNIGAHSIINKTGNTITNNGTLTITGTGTIDNQTHGKAALMNNGTVTVSGVTLNRSTDAGTGTNDSGGNSYSTVYNEGTMTLGNGTTVLNNGSYSSNINNGLKNEASLTIEDGVTVTGGLTAIKNDEKGTILINGGTFTPNLQHALLNWGGATINGGTFTSTNLATVCNGTYEGSLGTVEINNGTFNANTGVSNLGVFTGYPSENFTVKGGTFTYKPKDEYIASNYTVSEIDGKFVVVEASDEEVAKDNIDDFINNLESDTMIVEADPDVENTYNIVTSNGSIADSGLIDTVAAQEGVSTITVSNGSASEVYTAGGDLNAFKQAVDAMVPKTNDAEEVTLTMTIDFV